MIHLAFRYILLLLALAALIQCCKVRLSDRALLENVSSTLFVNKYELSVLPLESVVK